MQLKVTDLEQKKLLLLISKFIFILFSTSQVLQIIKVLFNINIPGQFFIISFFSLFLIYAYILTQNKPIYISKLQIFCFFVFFIAIFNIILQKLFFPKVIDKQDREVVSFIFALLRLMFIYFLLGICTSKTKLSESNRAVFFLISLLFIFIYLNIPNGQLFIDYEILAAKVNLTTVEINHLLIGPPLTYMGFFIYTLATKKIKPFVFLFFMWALFAHQGRGALFLFCATIIIMEFFLLDRKRSIMYIGILVSISFFLASLALIDSNFSRMMFFSSGISKDISLLERLYQFYIGLTLLHDQIWIGNLGLIVKEFGSIGAYMHNILSAWQFLGLFYFILFCILLAAILRKSIYCLKYDDECNFLKTHNIYPIMQSFLLCYYLLRVLLVDTAFNFYLYYAIGYWSAKQYTDCKNSKKINMLCS